MPRPVASLSLRPAWRLEQALVAVVGAAVLLDALPAFAPGVALPAEHLRMAAFILAAACLIAVAGRRRVVWWGWVLVALAMVLYAAGTVLWRGLPLPKASIGIDGLWATGSLLLVLGILALLLQHLPSLHRAVRVDLALVTSGLFAVTAAGAAAVVSAFGGLSTGWVLDAGLLFGDILLLSIAISVTHALRWRPPLAVRWIVLAIIVHVATDLAYAIAALRGTYRSGGPLDLGWVVAAFLLCLAAVTPDAAAPTTPARTSAQTTMPAGMIVAAAMVLLVPLQGQLGLLAKAVGVITVLLAVLRMDGAVRWATALADQLRVARADALTGLPNRRAIQALAASELAGAAFIALDLDGLTDINARHGTDAGDQVLVQAAHRLRERVEEGDIVARIGGDDFGVVVRDVEHRSVERIAEQLVMALEVELPAESVTVRVSACAGISGRTAEPREPEQLMAEADVALKEAKRIGTGIVRTYTGSTGERSQERLRVRAEIKEAFRAGGEAFVPYFHPITSVEDGSILAVETLVRWHRDGEVWTPGRFIPEVEQSGSMGQLTERMLHASLAQLRAAALPIPATVNVPPDLVNAALPALVRRALEASGSSSEQLIIEITEDAIMRNPAAAAAVLRELRDEGVRVLLDDFGTGWSGLSSLRDLVVDGLKMDGSFIHGIISDPTTSAIVRSVAGLAEHLGVIVIYEGVEDPALLAEVDAFANGYIQGFAISQPMPIEALERWVRVRAIHAASRRAGDQATSRASIW